MVLTGGGGGGERGRKLTGGGGVHRALRGLHKLNSIYQYTFSLLQPHHFECVCHPKNTN